MPATAPLNRVDVWTIRTDTPVVRERLTAYRKLLSNDEARRVERYVQPDDGMRFVLGRAMARTMLSRNVDMKPRDWPFVIDEHGRPQLAMRPAHAPELRFNLTHTKGLVSCAVTVGREVGIDVEHI